MSNAWRKGSTLLRANKTKTFEEHKPQEMITTRNAFVMGSMMMSTGNTN
jgi:hypothetical protein